MQKTQKVMAKNVLAAAVILSMFQLSYADVNAQQQQEASENLPKSDLGTLKVVLKSNKEIGKQTITAEQISRKLAADSRDLVRHETGVTVVEAGRFGSSGYAIRGVDENRVGISIDGLRQAETLASPGFKELFDGYGNFNNTRNSVELENLKTATIIKGADSASSGSGALGGAVSFETKEAKDLLTDNPVFASYKTGFSSVNNQKFGTVTLAAQAGKLDALLVATRRNGHEIENYNHDILYPTIEDEFNAVGAEREKADPYHITTASHLLKLGFEPNDNHRFSITYDDSHLNSKGDDLSYVLRSGSYIETITKGERKTNDESNRRNVQFIYKHSNPNALWDNLSLAVSEQKIQNKARTDEFCHAPTCNGVRNLSGLNLVEKDGIYVLHDGYGGEVQAEAVPSTWSTRLKLTDSKGEELREIREYSTDNLLIDCSKLNCNNKFRLVMRQNADKEDVFAFVDRQITVKTVNGREYGYIIPEKKEITRTYSWSTTPFTEISSDELRFVLPRSAGFQENQYKDRDLNTKTRQIKLDLNKAFELGRTNHRLKYGALFEITNKSMVNEDGYSGGNVQWWADNFICNKYVNGTFPAEYEPAPNHWPTNCNFIRKKVGEKDSYLLPVKTQNGAFYISDKVKLTDWLSTGLSYRYDEVKLTPSYDPAVPVPKGLIAGTFIPVPKRWYGENAPCGYNTDCLNENLAQNLEILLQNQKYSHHSYGVDVALDPTKWLRVQAKYSNGFRSPTADEVYMTFKHPSFSLQPNINLKPEIAKTQEAAVTLHKDRSFITFNAFKTDYDNFIDLQYIGERPIDVGSVLLYPFYQNVNRESAKVKGFEVSSHLDFGLFSERYAGVHAGYKLTHQKGRLQHQDDGEIPMNAIQPTTSVYNFGYADPNDKFGFDIYATHVAAKKAEDTYNVNWRGWKERGKLVDGKPVTDSTLAWRNNKYLVWDLIAYYKPIKNVTFSGGVFNVTNQRYMTWDSARSIRGTGTVNLINQETGEGINRFYAPERNYRIAMELKF